MKSLPLLILISFFIVGCAGMPTAQEFFPAFAQMTQTKYLTGAEATVRVANGSCAVVNNHSIAARIGFTHNDDMVNGARQVDGVLLNDGANSYRINSYQWVRANSSGATQLMLNVTALLCD